MGGRNDGIPRAEPLEGAEEPSLIALCQELERLNLGSEGAERLGINSPEEGAIWAGREENIKKEEEGS